MHKPRLSKVTLTFFFVLFLIFLSSYCFTKLFRGYSPEFQDEGVILLRKIISLKSGFPRSVETVPKVPHSGALCPLKPPGLRGKLDEDSFFKSKSWLDIMLDNKELTTEGRYYPIECKARHRVAIIIPLRGRETQLQTLLSHMHPIWKRQQIDYQVYIITQGDQEQFNRATLLNAGVAEANKDREYDCFVFHDVDLLLENDHCLYWCHEDNPRHMAIYMNKFSYEVLTYLPYCRVKGVKEQNIQYFGGVSMLTKSQFIKVNGFSNLYWGWGGEDDDLFFRLQRAGYSLVNPYGRNCSYRMIKHKRESSNRENNQRNILLKHSAERMREDGYNSLKYKLISRDPMYLYTNITVELNQEEDERFTKMMTDNVCESVSRAQTSQFSLLFASALATKTIMVLDYT